MCTPGSTRTFANFSAALTCFTKLSFKFALSILLWEKNLGKLHLDNMTVSLVYTLDTGLYVHNGQENLSKCVI